MVRKIFSQQRLPLALSAAALTVSLFHAGPPIRVGQAADAQVTDRQRQALVTLQDAFTSIAEAVEPAVVGMSAVT